VLAKSAKLSGYTEFDLDDGVVVVCQYYETRYSWGHYAELAVNGVRVGNYKATYYNRTWESYTYQSAVHSVLGGYFTGDKLEGLKAKADELGGAGSRRESKRLDALVKMAGIIGTPDTQGRALEVLTGGAVTLPDDWDKLPEDEKRTRLDKVSAVLSE